MLSYCDHWEFNLTGDLFIFLFMVTSRGIFICSADTSIFSVAHVDLSSKQLNDDLNKISEWALQWKMAFNPDLSKQAQEIVFSCKTHKISCPKVNFNNSPVVQSIYQKHLVLYLDEKLNFSHHIKEKISKS